MRARAVFVAVRSAKHRLCKDLHPAPAMRMHEQQGLCALLQPQHCGKRRHLVDRIAQRQQAHRRGIRARHLDVNQPAAAGDTHLGAAKRQGEFLLAQRHHADLDTRTTVARGTGYGAGSRCSLAERDHPGRLAAGPRTASMRSALYSNHVRSGFMGKASWRSLYRTYVLKSSTFAVRDVSQSIGRSLGQLSVERRNRSICGTIGQQKNGAVVAALS